MSPAEAAPAHDDATIDRAVARMSLRERALDPQLPERALPAVTGSGPDGPYRLVASRRANPRAVGVVTTQMLAPSDPEALWTSLRSAELELMWEGDADAVDELLGEWIGRSAPDLGEPGDWESSLRLRVPSRDSALVRPLLSRGFALIDVTAIRVGGRGADEEAALERLAAAGVVLRPATPADAELLGVMDSELLAHDLQHGGLALRERASATLQQGIEERLGIDPEWTWVIEQAGEPVGFLSIEIDRERHREKCADTGRVAYIQAMYLRPTVRGGGLGEAVVDFAHGRLETAGFDRLLLSYAALNPRSGPFWCRMGYRPLWSTWHRKPARQLV